MKRTPSRKVSALKLAWRLYCDRAVFFDPRAGSLKAIARKAGVPYGTLRDVVKRERWQYERAHRFAVANVERREQEYPKALALSAKATKLAGDITRLRAGDTRTATLRAVYHAAHDICRVFSHLETETVWLEMARRDLAALERTGKRAVISAAEVFPRKRQRWFASSYRLRVRP